MTERDLPGVPGEQHQAEANGRIDADELKLGENVAADEIRRRKKEQSEQPVPEDLPAVLKQPDVLRVAGLEEETHQSRPPLVPAKAGPQSRRKKELDSRLRGNERSMGLDLLPRSLAENA